MKKIKILIGGTFEVIHEGHISLITEVFNLIKNSNKKCILYFGLTDEKIYNKKHRISPFLERKKKIIEILNKFKFKLKISNQKLEYLIIKIYSFIGISLLRYYNYIIVSTETKKNAILINKIRNLTFKKKIKIIEKKMKLDINGIPISTTNILNKLN